MTRALANGRHFPATGPGWQTRINDALRRAAIAARWDRSGSWSVSATKKPMAPGRARHAVAAVLMPHNGQFKPGNPGGGRPLGSRNRLTEVALQMLGDHAIRIWLHPIKSMFHI